MKKIIEYYKFYKYIAWRSYFFLKYPYGNKQKVLKIILYNPVLFEKFVFKLWSLFEKKNAGDFFSQQIKILNTFITQFI